MMTYNQSSEYLLYVVLEGDPALIDFRELNLHYSRVSFHASLNGDCIFGFGDFFLDVVLVVGPGEVYLLSLGVLDLLDASQKPVLLLELPLKKLLGEPVLKHGSDLVLFISQFLRKLNELALYLIIQPSDLFAEVADDFLVPARACPLLDLIVDRTHIVEASRRK